MSASNEELNSNLTDGLSDRLSSGVQRYRTRDREVEYVKPLDQLKAKLMLDALTSPRRGMSVARINNARGTD